MNKGKVIVIQFVTLDGVVEDPDGTGGTPGGGWAFRSGAERVVGDDFKLGTDPRGRARSRRGRPRWKRA